MKPEDIEDFTEENKNEEIEQTNTDSQEMVGNLILLHIRNIKYPGRVKGVYPIICRGCTRIGFWIMLRT